MILICDSPPPLNGMSQVNQFMTDLFIAEGAKISTVNTSPIYKYSGVNSAFGLTVRFLHRISCIFRIFILLCCDRSPVVYRAINGGKGQVYDVFYLLLSRIFRRKVFVHHHCYAYISKKSYLFALLVFVSGSNVRHIVLGNRMKDGLSQLYNIPPEQVSVISNLSFFTDLEMNAVSESKILMLGHLANLCVEKGVGTFIELCRNLSERNIPFKAQIAGPFADKISEQLVVNAVSELKQLDYIGPVYGNDKEKFFSALDLFVFPSQYNNEAEPLVLYEAAQTGTYLVASDVGCIPDVLDLFDGACFSEMDALVSECVGMVQNKNNNLLFSQDVAFNRLKLFKKELTASINKRDSIIESMISLDQEN